MNITGGTFKEHFSEVQLDRSFDSKSTLVMIFGAGGKVPSFLHELSQFFSQSLIVGCSGAGVVFNDHFIDDGFAIAVVQFDSVELRLHHAEYSPSSDFYQIGNDFGAEIATWKDLRHVLLLTDGLAINAENLLRGFQASGVGLAEKTTLTGGLASDGLTFQQTWTYANGKLSSCGILAVGLCSSSVWTSSAAVGNWDRVGLPRKVTKSIGNELFEIDGMKALDIYSTFLGSEISLSLPGSALLFPIALVTDGEPDKVRTILGLNKESGSMIFGGDLPVGSTMYIMKARINRLLAAPADAAKAALPAKTQVPVMFAFAVSCVGRRAVLGEKSELEVSSLIEALPPRSVVIGFHSNGEINYLSGGDCKLLNQTFSVTLIGEPELNA